MPDPRAANARHSLSSILTIALCAVISGADTFTEIEQYALAKQPWRERMMALPHGVPTPDTFRRVFMILDPTVWHERFFAWTQALLLPEPNTPTELIAIYRKRARRSTNPDQPFAAIATVSAWAAEYGLVLAQEQVSAATETRIIPALLASLDLAGATVTIDAAPTRTSPGPSGSSTRTTC